jgi:hypothetical protein
MPRALREIAEEYSHLFEGTPKKLAVDFLRDNILIEANGKAQVILTREEVSRVADLTPLIVRRSEVFIYPETIPYDMPIPIERSEPNQVDRFLPSNYAEAVRKVIDGRFADLLQLRPSENLYLPPNTWGTEYVITPTVKTRNNTNDIEWAFDDLLDVLRAQLMLLRYPAGTTCAWRTEPEWDVWSYRRPDTADTFNTTFVICKMYMRFYLGQGEVPWVQSGRGNPFLAGAL